MKTLRPYLLMFTFLGTTTGLAVSLSPKLFIHFLSIGIFSLAGFHVTMSTIPNLKAKFVKAKVTGVDMCKQNAEPIPEAMGVIAGSVFLITMSLFIPIPFLQFDKTRVFDDLQFESLIAALLSICCMVLLGFVDDILDLRWLHKLTLPTIASFPLLTVYAVTYNCTWVLLPKPFSFALNLGIFYYVYMAMMAVFCTNAINILAGINGLEVGQSLIISLSVLIFNLIEITSTSWKVHLFSITFILPFICVSSALLWYNWYPAEIFVGDTYCYFAGMTFAVVGILGHFSKTMLLFFIPQIFNFLFSCPQLFHFVPCPRHRLPKYNPKTNLMNNSHFEYNPKQLGIIGYLCLKFARLFRLCHEQTISPNKVICTNFTLINLVILWFGPKREDAVVRILLFIQIACSAIAFFLRYYIVQFIY
uniref:UDP-N-acetylglucosamine--dolichyl-phosphate N-acetylglucosaminephosphotransferase n=1 Tax=Tetranychus urticae TaxID=32264 RepID=T1JPR7_TETUR